MHILLFREVKVLKMQNHQKLCSNSFIVTYSLYIAAFVRVTEDVSSLKFGEAYTLVCEYPNLDPEFVYWQINDKLIYFYGENNFWRNSKYKGNIIFFLFAFVF